MKPNSVAVPEIMLSSAFVSPLDLSGDESAALIAMDEGAFARFGVHPFLPFMDRLQLEREE